MNQPSLRPPLFSFCCLLLIAGGALSCSSKDSGSSGFGADVVRISADACQREVGTLMALASMSVPAAPERNAALPERDAAAAIPLQVLGDLRPSLISDLPGRFSYTVEKNAAQRLLSTAVRRIRSDREDTVRAEVFWRQGEQLQSLIAVDLPSGDEGWHEVQVEVPAGQGELVFSHRFDHAGLAEQSGEPIAWSQPVLAPIEKPQQADVILLTIDTLRADAVKHAPFLDSLMNSGRRWHAAYSPSNWTLPAYASLMTGLPPEEHGCGRGPFSAEAGGEMENRNFRAMGVATTVAEAMRDAGYATCMLFQNPLLESWTNLDRGFDRYLRSADRAASNHDAALSWWQQNQHRSRFLALHYMAPHLPYELPSNTTTTLASNPLDALNPEKLLELDHSPAEREQYFDLSTEDRELVRQWYYADIAAMDAELRTLITELRASSPDCVILIHADHGEELWDAGSFEHGHSFAESVIHVPLAMVREGVIEAESIMTPVAAHHLGTLMLEELGIPNRLPPSALSNAKYADLRIRSTFPLYRSNTGGRELQADGSWVDLPFSLEGSVGNPGMIDAETAARMAALGYSGDRED